MLLQYTLAADNTWASRGVNELPGSVGRTSITTWFLPVLSSNRVAASETRDIENNVVSFEAGHPEI